MNTTNERNTYATEAVVSSKSVKIDFAAIKSIDAVAIKNVGFDSKISADSTTI